MLRPYGEYTESQFYNTFREQVEYLLEGGVNGFIVETMLDLREALCAVRACRDTASLPVIGSLSLETTNNDGRTIMGNSAKEISVGLADAGVATVGANCGDLDPLETATVICRSWHNPMPGSPGYSTIEQCLIWHQRDSPTA